MAVTLSFTLYFTEPKRPVLKLTPYKTPARKKGNNSQKEQEIEELNSKINSRTHLEDGNGKTFPSSLQSNEELPPTVFRRSLHTGKKVWGPGGLVKGRRRSGSIDSSVSGSSSKSSEPEKIPVKTSSQVSLKHNRTDIREPNKKRQIN